ncbi:MAG: hypothetical protein JNL21_02650 [Myxococcales bacterium]|nr:hypothetical protein [Myxococcales bacterium]
MMKKTQPQETQTEKKTKTDDAPRPKLQKIRTGIKAGARAFRASDPCSGDEFR